MVALYRAGRQSEALAAFQVARQRMADELGLEPGTQLQEQRKILEHDPSLDRSGERRRETEAGPAPRDGERGSDRCRCCNPSRVAGHGGIQLLRALVLLRR